MGHISILCVGKGDTKLVFDRDKPEESERAARVVKDMLRNGYVILIEVDDGSGGKTHARVDDFVEGTFEYIIADGENTENAAATASKPRTRKTKVGTKRVPAAGTSGVAIGRPAGG